MKKEIFLENFNSVELKEKLWDLFNRAEKKAKESFSNGFNGWLEIRRVVVDPENYCDCDKGIIYLNPAMSNLGAIFHEIFHFVFHKSTLWHSDELHKNLHNSFGMWGDAFCDTFRYFMEEKLLDEKSRHKWFGEMNQCLIKTPYEIQEEFSDDRCHNLKYKIPTSIIIKKVKKNYDKFKNLWKELNKRFDRQSCNFLEDYFCFKMKEEQEKLGCRE